LGKRIIFFVAWCPERQVCDLGTGAGLERFVGRFASVSDRAPLISCTSAIYVAKAREGE
jgi:hypothetical protein